MYQSLSSEAEVMFLKVVIPLAVLCLTVEGSRLVGAPMDTTLADQGAQDALRFAVAQYNGASHDMYLSKVSRVISVQKQVVSGMKYIFTVEMARTSCRKDLPQKNCPVYSNPALARRQICRLAVWSQPWKKTNVMVENTCR
uniref:Cystatin domain-containing protein n=2 Tax=Pygocentrus nattereri TaxID=42514 RepID=A0AAR2LLG4_PYGNA